MKQFFIASLIVSAFVYIGASIYSSTFIPFSWIDKGGIIFFWGVGIVVSAGIVKSKN